MTSWHEHTFWITGLLWAHEESVTQNFDVSAVEQSVKLQLILDTMKSYNVLCGCIAKHSVFSSQYHNISVKN